MQSSQPLVSVVIPCYNHEQFVKDSIQSVIDQTYNNIELIIIDDGSKDSSIEKIEEMIELCKKRFNRFEFRSRANIGLSATLNEALEWCKGKYFSAIASDDIFLPNKIELQINYMEKNNKILAVFGGVIHIDQDNKEISRKVGTNKFYDFEDIIMHNHQISTPTAMLKIEALRRIGGYDNSLFIEDWYMWLKISEHGSIFAMEDILALYRQHINNSSKKFSKMHSGRLEVLKRFEHSAYYEKAVKNIVWINIHEEFMVNKKIKGFLRLFFLNPKKTVSMTINYCKRCIVENNY